MVGLIIYALVVTVALLFTVWVIVRTARDGDSAARRTEDELRQSRETVGRVRTTVADCRRVLEESNGGLAGTIERLRTIAEKVKDLEDIVNSGSSS